MGFACWYGHSSPDIVCAELRQRAPQLGGNHDVSPEIFPSRIVLSRDRRPTPHLIEPSSDQIDDTNDLALVPAPPERTSPSTLAPPLTAYQRGMRDRIRRVIAYYHKKPLNTLQHSPWEVMHTIIAYGVDSTIRVGGPRGKSTTAVGWLCFNRPTRNKQLFYLSGDQMATRQGPGLEGHRGQLLAMLAQARVKEDYPIRIQGREFTVADLIEYEKRTCYPGTELTFKLIALNHYLDPDATWKSDQGQSWDLPRLIREEMAQPIRGVTCGGTHRLAGLSLAVKKRQALGLPIDGEYARARQFIGEYQRYAVRLQNRDGSFSTDWFRGRGDDPDLERRLRTTGHILEWLIYSLPEQDLTDRRIVRAVEYLTNHMWQHRSENWDAGPLGHAVHALVLYDQYVFGSTALAAANLSLRR